MPPPLIARNDFRIGYTAQHEWAWLITAAFFFGSVGAGLFLVSYFVGFWQGALAGLLSVAVLKSIAHVLFLGKPLRAWRAVAKWRTSWPTKRCSKPPARKRRSPRWRMARLTR